MRFDQFTVKAAEAVQSAQERATSAGHSQFEPLHLLLSLLNPGGGGGVCVPILEKVGVNVDRLCQIAEGELSRRPKVTGGQISSAPELEKVLQKAQAEADRLKDKYVSTEHLLLALADVESTAKQVLSIAGSSATPCWRR